MSDTPNVVAYGDWLRKRGRASSTIEQNSRLLRRLLAKDDPTSELLDRSKSPMYRHSMAAALRSWALFSGDDELAARLSDLRMPARLPRGSREPLVRREWFRIAEVIESSDALPKALRAALLMMVVRGLRCGDVLRLDRKSLKRAERTGTLMLVANGERLISIHVEPIRDAVGDLLLCSWRKDARVASLIVSGGRSECQHASASRAVRRALDSIADELGFERCDLYPHRFRHTYVHHFLSELRGDPEALVKVQQQMGWARMETAGSYMRRARREELDAVESKLLSGRKNSPS